MLPSICSGSCGPGRRRALGSGVVAPLPAPRALRCRVGPCRFVLGWQIQKPKWRHSRCRLRWFGRLVGDGGAGQASLNLPAGMETSKPEAWSAHVGGLSEACLARRHRSCKEAQRRLTLLDRVGWLVLHSSKGVGLASSRTGRPKSTMKALCTCSDRLPFTSSSTIVRRGV